MLRVAIKEGQCQNTINKPKLGLSAWVVPKKTCDNRANPTSGSGEVYSSPHTAEQNVLQVRSPCSFCLQHAMLRHPPATSGNTWTAAPGLTPIQGPSPNLQKRFPSEEKLDHGWPESRTSQARSAQRCRMRSFSLHFVKQARDSTRQGALRKLVGASWSAQVALRKLHCASCSAQVAPRKLLRQVGPCKWLPASCSVQIALPASCSVQAALRKLLCASCSA